MNGKTFLLCSEVFSGSDWTGKECIGGKDVWWALYMSMVCCECYNYGVHAFTLLSACFEEGDCEDGESVPVRQLITKHSCSCIYWKQHQCNGALRVFAICPALSRCNSRTGTIWHVLGIAVLDVGNHCAYNTRTSRFLPLPGVLAEGKDVAGEVAFARTTTLWRRATPFNEAGSARSPPPQDCYWQRQAKTCYTRRTSEPGAVWLTEASPASAHCLGMT